MTPTTGPGTILLRMKLTKKNTGAFVTVVLLGLVIGSLAWEIFERILMYADVEIALSVGPIGLDIDVIAVWLRINPGSFAGVLGAALVFRRL